MKAMRASASRQEARFFILVTPLALFEHSPNRWKNRHKPCRYNHYFETMLFSGGQEQVNFP
jgi:hypothetical protein